MNRIAFNIMGPQGSGKGTQAKVLIDQFGFSHFDAGASLREIRATGSELGKLIASYLDKGLKVPVELMAQVMYDKVKSFPQDRPVLFDGLLRSLDELEAQRPMFEKLDLPLPVIINFNLDEEEAVERIGKRRLCEHCGRFSTVDQSHDAKTCPYCGGHLTIRHDDTPEAIKQRLSWHYKDTVPVIDWFREHGTVIDIDARPGIEEVSHAVITEVHNYLHHAGVPHHHDHH